MIRLFCLFIILALAVSCENLSSTPATDTDIGEVDRKVYYSGLIRTDDYIYFNLQDSIQLSLINWTQYSSCLNYEIKQRVQVVEEVELSYLFYEINSEGDLKSSCSFESSKDSMITIENTDLAQSQTVYLLGYSQDSTRNFTEYLADSLILRNGARVEDTLVVGIDSTGDLYSLNIDTANGESFSRTFLIDSVNAYKRVSEKVCDVEFQYCEVPRGVDTLWTLTSTADSLKADTLEWVLSAYCEDGKEVCRSGFSLNTISLAETDSVYEFKTFYSELVLTRTDCSRDEHREVKNNFEPNSTSVMGVWNAYYTVELDYFEMDRQEESCLGEIILDTLNLGL